MLRVFGRGFRSGRDAIFTGLDLPNSSPGLEPSLNPGTLPRPGSVDSTLEVPSLVSSQNGPSWPCVALVQPPRKMKRSLDVPRQPSAACGGLTLGGFPVLQGNEALQTSNHATNHPQPKEGLL